MMFLPLFSVGVLWTMASTTRVMARQMKMTSMVSAQQMTTLTNNGGNGNGAADNDDDDDNDGNNDSDGAADDGNDNNDVNDDNLPPRVGKRNDGFDETKTEEEETVTDSVEIHTTIKQITERGGGRW